MIKTYSPIDCRCESPEHLTIWEYDPKQNHYTVHIMLCHRPLYERIINAIKYTFGYTCKYGYWDEFVFKKEDLRKLLNRP